MNVKLWRRVLRAWLEFFCLKSYFLNKEHIHEKQQQNYIKLFNLINQKKICKKRKFLCFFMIMMEDVTRWWIKIVKIFPKTPNIMQWFGHKGNIHLKYISLYPPQFCHSMTFSLLWWWIIIAVLLFIIHIFWH